MLQYQAVVGREDSFMLIGPICLFAYAAGWFSIVSSYKPGIYGLLVWNFIFCGILNSYFVEIKDEKGWKYVVLVQSAMIIIHIILLTTHLLLKIKPVSSGFDIEIIEVTEVEPLPSYQVKIKDEELPEYSLHHEGPRSLSNSESCIVY
jgi:hypothetical protein